MTVPFNRPALIGAELRYIEDAVLRGQLSGDGYYTKKCEELIRNAVKGHSAHLTHSCTAALEMAAILCNLRSGDEVIMPSYTFVSTANAVVLRGATPVFVDIEPDTLNIDPVLVAEAVTEKTKAVFVVHYAGVVCDIDPIRQLCRDRGLILVEDAAQALGSKRSGEPAGSFGDFAAFSFHETKNIIAGEGGCLITNDESYQLRAEIIREKGTNRRAFQRGSVDKYTWVDIGSSYLPGELVSAFLFAQLEMMQQINADRIHNWNRYHDSLESLEAMAKLKRPTIPEDCEHNGHMYYILVDNERIRNDFIQYMRAKGITSPFHYVPLHSAPYGLRSARTHGSLFHTDTISRRLVRLPLYSGVSESIEQILSAVHEYPEFQA